MGWREWIRPERRLPAFFEMGSERLGPLPGLTMVTGSGTSRASISPASAALRSASTQRRPSPWSRVAWPGWTPTLSCCLSSVPCPP